MLIAGLLAIGFLLGSIPFGVIFARSKGIDIFKTGSGNPGATNVWRTMGPALGAIVFLLDVAKGFLPTWLAYWITGDLLIALGAGFAAILGHSFSPFLGFRGGKGISTGLGVLLGSVPIPGLIAFSVFLVTLAVSRYVSLSSIVAAFALVVASLLFHLPILVTGCFATFALFVVIRHHSNIGRLLRGEERKFSLRSPSQSNPGSPTEAGSNSP